MSDATTYNEEQFIGRSFEGVDADPAPDPVYLCLWGSAPANAPDPTNEISGDGYSPQQVAAADWTRTSTGAPTSVENAVEVDFGVLDSASSTTIEGAVVADGPDTSTANFLFANDDVSEVVDAGNEFKFNVGNASFSMD